MFDVSRYRISEANPVSLDSYDPGSKEGFEGGKAEGKEALHDLRKKLSALQRRLWAESSQKLLVILQAIDTGGKDGTIRHVFSGVNPQGVRVYSYGKPSETEIAHDYLWRIHHNTPANGLITIFNRSHYEDVLVVRVKGLAPESVWEKRYQHINDFERMLTDEGTTIVKIFLFISKDEQRQRLQARLDEPDQTWKFHLSDLDDRALWDDYQAAFEAMISRTATEYAPWYVVPANRRWYRNVVVSSILIQTLEKMNPQLPPPEPGLDGLVVQ